MGIPNKLKFKKLDNNAKIPSYANDGDAGIDLVATSVANYDSYSEYGTGLSVEIPRWWAGFLFPRSSISNTRHILRNSVGVIDSGYRGEIKIRMGSLGFGKYDFIGRKYEVGERVAQLVLIQVPRFIIEEVADLNPSKRGDGGFGSTGK